MQAGLKNACECIKAFSETDFTEDLKKFDVPTPSARSHGHACGSRQPRLARVLPPKQREGGVIGRGLLHEFPIGYVDAHVLFGGTDGEASHLPWLVRKAA